MPALANKTYFNYGGQGPLPDPSLAAINRAWGTIQELGPFTDRVWPFLARTQDDLRQRLATWLGVAAHRIAFTENVTSGCVLPLWGLPWQEGDELLLSDAEHPGVVAACRELARRHGLVIGQVPVAHLGGSPATTARGLLESLERHLTPATRLVALSHLLWNTGQTLPIEAVAERLAAHPRRPWLLVDAAQSFGSMELGQAPEQADIYAVTGHKWCCGPEGLGAVAVSERLLAESSPTLIGWRSLSFESSSESGFHRDARRFEVATSCLPLFAGLQTSLELLEAEGDGAARAAAIRARSRQLWEGLRSIPAVRTLLSEPPPAGLVSFQLVRPGPEAARQSRDPRAVVAELGEQGIWLRTLADPPCLRACTHLTTTAEEVERLLQAVGSIAARA